MSGVVRKINNLAGNLDDWNQFMSQNFKWFRLYLYNDTPLPLVGYPFIVLVAVGWGNSCFFYYTLHVGSVTVPQPLSGILRLLPLPTHTSFSPNFSNLCCTTTPHPFLSQYHSNFQPPSHTTTPTNSSFTLTDSSPTRTATPTHSSPTLTNLHYPLSHHYPLPFFPHSCWPLVPLSPCYPHQFFPHWYKPPVPHFTLLPPPILLPLVCPQFHLSPHYPGHSSSTPTSVPPL